MLPFAFAPPRCPPAPLLFALAGLLAATPAVAADPSKAACFADAKRLCPAEVQSLSRAKVRACLIAQIDRTSPVCHDFMVKARAAALAGKQPDQAKP